MTLSIIKEKTEKLFNKFDNRLVKLIFMDL